MEIAIVLSNIVYAVSGAVLTILFMMLGYKILGSEVTAEMELMVIQALVGSLSRPSLPDSFPEDLLLINWHFVYPPMRPQLDLRR